MAATGNPHHRTKYAVVRLVCHAVVVGLGFATGALARAADAAAQPELVEQPLAARSGPRGPTMFVTVAPEQSGLVTENRYADPTMLGERFQEFTLGASGTGIAIGDFDNDGRPDVFVVSKTEACRLFRNLGNWKFEDVTDKAGLNGSTGNWAQSMAWVKEKMGAIPTAANDPSIWKQGATFVDVNNDGWLDLYVCRFAAPNLLFINQHDGTFKEEAAARGLAVVDASAMAAFCDYDRDGWLDVYVQTNMLDGTAHPTGQRDYLFHNNGDGTFTNVTDRAGISGETQGHSAIWWDYDGDGWPDLYVANDFSVPDRLYRNNRDGTFTNVISRVVPHTSFSSMGADLGDVNNDGLIDLFVAEMAATSHQKDQRGMANSRALNTEEPEDSTAASQYARNVLYVNTGTGACLEAAYLAGIPATDWTWSPRFEDLDNDGRLDLHVTNGMIRELHNVDVLARVMEAETPSERVRVVRTGPPLTDANMAFRNLGDLQFENVSAAWGLDQKTVSFGSAFADFDGDGDLDLIYANYQGGATLLRNDSDTGHRLIIALRGTRSNRFGIGSTVRIETAGGVQVRSLVLARGVLSNSEPIVHFGLGPDTVIKRLTVSWPSGAVQNFENLTGDRRLTITEPSTTAPARPSPNKDDTAPAASARPRQFVEVGKAAGIAVASRESPIAPEVPQPFLPFRQNRRGPAVALGDLNGDDVDDLVIGGTTSDPARLMLGRKDGSGFDDSGLETLKDSSPVDDGPVLVFDADGDGSNDVLVTKGGAALSAGAAGYQPRLYLNNGHGGFKPAASDALPPLAISVGALAAADFDRDGRLDVFIGGRVIPGKYPLPPRSALLLNRGGTFEDVTETVAPGLLQLGLVTSALWTDVDGDGWSDLLVALEWGGIRYFHNNAGRGFEDRSESAGFAAAGTGWWTSLASADFNGDGRPDYIAGNVGLNTQYTATPEHPALIYYGDFRGSGAPLLIEAYYEGDRLYPRRTRKDLGSEIPAVLKRFNRNDAYARATLAEIFSEERLAAARRFAVTEFRSGVFLSQADGMYHFEPLPRIAQIAPFQGVVAGDFDGDGFADIYTVQNSYAPIPAIGHFAGGLSQFLRGDGHGHFTPVPPAESGLVVRGDAKALVTFDLGNDGWPDFVATRNNQTALAYRNSGVEHRHSFRVVLRGPVGNPTAIGASVTVELSDGSTQTTEVHAGSGYFSQSGGACFFGYPDENPPRQLRVRWPTGTRTVHELTNPGAAVTITAPKS